MKKKIAWIVLAVLAVVLAGGSYFIGDQVVEASTNLVTNQQTLEMYRGSWESEGFEWEPFAEKYAIEERSLVSDLDGHTLTFDVITAEGNENVAVMVHGMMGCRLTNYPTAEIFLENGYDVVSFDQRSSGGNTAPRSTFGQWEKYDLIDCVHYARERFPDAKIVIWGESFGGITALLGAAEVQEEISALILDCPVSRMDAMIESELGKMGIPLPTGYMMACGNFVCKHKLGFAFEDADGTAAAEKIAVPTLVFNSEADEITPEWMGREVFDHLASEEKELYTSETSAHIEIRNHEREVYVQKILEILP